MNFETKQATDAYKELSEIADRNKAEILHIMKSDVDNDIGLVATIALQNTKLYAETMAMAIDTACKIERETIQTTSDLMDERCSQ